MTLLHVPALQILVIQRVNTSFREVIKESGPLQEKLFLKPKPDNNNNVNRIEWNPFMRKLETGWENGHLQQSDWSGCGKIRMSDLINIHPNASWMRMLVCQPPRPKVEMMRFDHVSSGYLGFLAGVEMEEDGKGCRMSDIYKYAWQDDATLMDDCYVRVDR